MYRVYMLAVKNCKIKRANKSNPVSINLEIDTSIYC